MNRTNATPIVLIVLLATNMFLGCGDSNDQRVLQEALRKKKQRQSQASRSSESIEDRLAGIQKELSDGNAASAEILLKPILIAEPDNPKVLFLSAKCKAARGRFLEAVEIVETIKKDADPVAYRASLGQAADWLAEANRNDQAIEKLQQMIDEFGDTSIAYRKLAEMMNASGFRIRAAEYVRKLAAMGEAKEIELFSLITLSSPFVNLFDDSEDKEPPFSKSHLHIAKMEREYEQFTDAIVRCRRLAKAYPESPEIAAFLCRLFNETQDDEKLKDLAGRVPEGTEEQPEYWAALGGWCLRIDRPLEAVRCFCEAVSRDQTDRYAYLSLARSLTLVQASNQAKILTQASAGEILSEVHARHALLEEIAELAKKFGKQPGTRQEHARISELLLELRRPIEAYGWDRIALRRQRASDEAVRKLNDRLNAEVANPKPLPERWVTCGLRLDDWPRPKIAKLQLNSLPAKPRTSSDKPLLLRDVANSVGLDFKYFNGDDLRTPGFLLHQVTGGGIGVLDYDLDGWPDIYFTQGGEQVRAPDGAKPNQLFRNVQGQRFENVASETGTADLGYGHGVAAADVNQDGFIDMLVANFGDNLLFTNNGDGTFRREVLPAADGDNCWTTTIACGDVTGDNLPDAIEVNYVDDPKVLETQCIPPRDLCQPSRFRSAADRLLTLSDTGVLAIDETTLAGPAVGHGFAAVISNFDGQHGNDVFVANDGDRNHFWVSKQQEDAASKHRFGLADQALLRDCAAGMTGDYQGCMGIATGDFDRNGKLDLHVTNYWNQPADLYMLQTSNLFRNETFRRNITSSSSFTVGWGSQATDLDRDGWLDLMVMNGHVLNRSKSDEPYQQKPQLFRGSEAGFLPVPNQPQNAFWNRATLGRMLATLDWNRDGKTDFVAGHLDLPAGLLQNETEIGNWVRLALVGTQSERDAVGAEVRVFAGDQKWTTWVTGGDGILVTNEPVLEIGVGNETSITKIEIAWPSGATEVIESVEPNYEYLLVEGSGSVVRREY